MDAVNAFNHELFSLMDSKPPISRAKMISITKSAIKAIKLYKHVVQIVEKFIKKCKPEYKVPGLYVVDSIVRQSRHQFGADKDVFGPRFTKNITGTFENLCLCPTEDRSKIVRVLNLWQKNGVFKIEVIQPLLDMAAGSSSSGTVPGVDDGPGGAASPPSPAREAETHTAVSVNSVQTPVPQLQNTDAFAAVAQLFQSSQGQQLQQMLQTFQQPGKPQSPALENNMMTHLQIQASTIQPPTSLAQGHSHTTQPAEKKATFDKKLLDRFDYDDEPEGGEETKRDETSSVQPAFGFGEGVQPPQQASAVFPQAPNQMQHFQQHMMGMSQEHQVPSPNGQSQAFNRMPPQPYPGMMPPGVGPAGFPGPFPPQNNAFPQLMAGQQHQEASGELDTRQHQDGRKTRSRSGSRSPKRRRSRSGSRSRRFRHRRSRSRSRERRRHSPRSRSQERRDRERERERRQKGLPPIKPDTLSVCSTTLWVGQLDKRTQQQDVACLLEEFGQIESINMIPPRGCAYIVMVHRQDAFRALQKLSRGTYKVNQKAIKIAWALNKGIKSEFKQYWDVELGVTYVPWSKVKMEDLDVFKEGGMLDADTLSPGLPVRSQGDTQSDNTVMDNITVRQGETVLLSCSQGDVVTHTAWLNRSSILYAGEDKWSVDPRVSLVTLNRDEFTIKIENIDLSDEGLYVCAVQTSSKPRTTSVHIIVQVPPKIVSFSNSFVVNEGSNVTLMCLANGKPEPAISWKMLSLAANEDMDSEDEYFEIPSISRHKAGVYECTAANDIAIDTKTVTLLVNYPPTVSEGRDVGVTLGHTGVLRCEADAVPEADFEWYRDDRRIFNGFDGIEIENIGFASMLTFHNVSEADYGNYTCVAINKLGSANTSIILYEVIEPTSSTLLQDDAQNV